MEYRAYRYCDVELNMLKLNDELCLSTVSAVSSFNQALLSKLTKCNGRKRIQLFSRKQRKLLVYLF